MSELCHVCRLPGTTENPLGRVPNSEGEDFFVHLPCNTVARRKPAALMPGVDTAALSQDASPKRVLVLTERDARLLVQALAAFTSASSWPELGGEPSRRRLQQACAMLGYPDSNDPK